MPDPENLTVADAAEWGRWLTRNHDRVAGVWLVLAKGRTVMPTSLHYQEALEEAICFGWIDGQRRAGDAATYRHRFTPRHDRSVWSKRNVAIAERLIEEGRMHPAGAFEVERARADGRWDAAYGGQATTGVPEDLAAALGADPAAAAAFGDLDAGNRYSILYRIHVAKRPETRSRRIQEFVAMLARGERLHG